VPAGVWLAVTRYRLYTLDLLVARTLAYAATVAGLALLFVVVGAFVGLLIGGHSPVAVAAAAAITATAAAPIRTRVVAHVQRSVLGLAGDPERAAALVGQRLATVRDPDLIAEAAAQAVTDALRLPGVRVVLPHFPDDPAAESGVTLPLAHHGIRLGALTVPGPVSTAERRALVGVAVPVAAALHSAGLSREVRQSRAELLAAVEEERRRLRRDLHDGLGPKLAILAMGLDAAQNLAVGSPAETNLAVLFDRLRGQTDAMLGSLRHIVSGLRPPALDECGLAEALRRLAWEVAEPAGLSVELDSDELGPLAAAVEVAAYRIAAEAVLNAARHSGGQHCRLVLRGQDGLRLSVTDDGRGIPDLAPTGVGTQSMRERAAAVGGWVAIGPADRCGTEVRAWLPGVPA
jgi:two-component system, NarL family, sensor kinase